MALRKSKKSEVPAWRPDFRDADNLPDIKVIRTDFLLNLISISLAVVLLGVLVYREYRATNLLSSIATLEGGIEGRKDTDAANVLLSKEFTSIEQRIREVVNFHNVPIDADHLLIRLAETLPKTVVLSSINLSVTVEGEGRKRSAQYILTVAGTVDDLPEAPASAVTTEYQSTLRELDVLKPYFIDSNLYFNRLEGLRAYEFNVRIILGAEPVKKT